MEEQRGADAREKVLELLKDMRVGMLATRHDSGLMHARPMSTNLAEFHGEIWYLTSARSEKVADIERHAEVLVTYADPRKDHYVSVTGKATVVRDRAKLHELWTEIARVWFPKGEDDPDLCAIRVDVDSVEYWDVGSSTMLIAYGYVKALLTGKQPEQKGETGRATY